MKIYKIKGCQSCPNYECTYHGKAESYCMEMDKYFDVNAEDIPTWCPLEDAPKDCEHMTKDGHFCTQIGDVVQ
jgi:hypothetical protein